jgi:SAM-dependent methyltransferase
LDRQDGRVTTTDNARAAVAAVSTARSGRGFSQGPVGAVTDETEPELSAAELLALAHSRLTFNAPLGPERAAELVTRIADLVGRSAPVTVADLGCGQGELLLRLLEALPRAQGLGVDTDQRVLGVARTAAARRGLAWRARFVEADAALPPQEDPTGELADEPAPDVLISVGSSHLWADRATCHAELYERVAPGGVLLLGDGFWEAEPSEEAVSILGDLPTLPELAAELTAAGWGVLWLTTSTMHELDSWESDWRAGLELSGHPYALQLAAERLTEYLTWYRGTFGFAWCLLYRSA